ncbi:putative Type III restriction enzyme, res subunit [Nostocoides japonicum T1-X7]|uniref:Putative Type III restriction enzyme, res subunit n=1 Tax=Nostocoides japonicum T1-X7 TaxID=1194083 RepID=A0A077LY04_9MICO|nr:DEAD/DEAH box helicase [Tetrasphaera japonica]CCH76859.1 putative Type III restriction enzyme, res subunit [Tetrasphaera japonica T1-X7]
MSEREPGESLPLLLMPSPEKEIAELRRENTRLRRLLTLTEQEAKPARGTQTAWFERSPGPVTRDSSPRDKVAFYAALFTARRDVYALRWDNTRTGSGGWLPAVEGRWRKGMPAEHQRLRPLTPEVIDAHLRGDIRIGLYPMLAGDRTSWLAADFDGQFAMLDALAYLKAARAVGVPAALEISHSGVGAHVWVFFTEPVPAAAARRLGTSLLREAIALRGRMDLRCYDRLFPSQDVLRPGGIGNQIAAPLHGTSRKEGRTVFLDLATLEPHEDQFAYLSSLDRLAPRRLSTLLTTLRAPAVGTTVDRLLRADSTRTQPPAAPVVHLTLDGGIRIPGEELSPALYATLKHAASVVNPEFYDRQRRRQPTWNVPRFIHSFDETIDGRLVLPRGLLGKATQLVREAGSAVALDDQRVPGSPIEVAMTAELTPPQRSAVTDLVAREIGVLEAPPGSGKTVMACAVIAERRVSTLVLVDSKTLADQWRTQIDTLLGIRPGQLGGGRRKLTGVVDVATLQTLARRDDLGDRLAAYGLVVVDECHHVPAAAFEAAVRGIPARHWLGLTATPYRRDGLDDLIGFQLGPIAHTFVPDGHDTLVGSMTGRPTPRLVVHPTTYRYTGDADLSTTSGFTDVVAALVADEARNTQIVSDVVSAIGRGRNCLVLSRRVAHVELLARLLAERGLEPVVLTGGLGVRARARALGRLTGPGPLLLVATTSVVGEGFDAPALDTLFLVTPVSHKGGIVQYAGRILRVHPGKETAEVHDYHDVSTPVLAATLAKRAPGYVSLGFPDPRRG